MTRSIRFLAQLYPRSWRERYGVEFEALLEDVNPNWRTSFDILKGALTMQLRNWTAVKVLFAAGLIGAVAAFGVSFALPQRYVSEASIKVTAPAGFQTHQYVFRLAQETLSRTALTTIINMFGLYKGERAKMPIEDVIGVMRNDIYVDFRETTGNPEAFHVGFISENPDTAQKVTRALVTQFLDQNTRTAVNRYSPGDARPLGMTLELKNPATLPLDASFPQRPLISVVGLAIGLVMGGILWWFRRPVQPTP